MTSQDSSEAPRRLRIPAFIRDQVPHHNDTAPLLPKDIASANRGEVYAIRLRDTFFSAKHAFAVERGWVKAAMLHATSGLITHAPGKDSLLLVWGVDAAVRRYSLDHIAFFAPSGNKQTLSFDIEDDDEDVTFAVQADSQQDLQAIESLKGATVYKYKNYVAVKVSASDSESTQAFIRNLSSARMMPLQILTGADPNGLDACVTIQLDKQHDVSMVKQLWQSHYCYSPNKGQVRIYGMRENNQEHIAFLKTLPGVQFVLSATTLKTLANNSTPKPKKDPATTTTAERPRGNLIVIKRIDATPIAPAQAALLAKLLNLTKPSVKDGALLGLSSEAAALSGTLINGKFLIGWEAEM